MSDTPETDKQALVHTGASLHCVSVHFARKLERERDNLQDQRDFAMSEMERLKQERDEAREAAERYRRKTLSQDAEIAEAHRLLAAAKESLNAIHVEVGGWISATIEGGDK